MKILAICFVALIAALQSPLWFGKGGWLRVWEIHRDVEAQRAANEKLRTRNDALSAEVQDLKQGYEAIEERARSKLNMIKPDEIFVQWIEPAPGDADKALGAAPVGASTPEAAAH